MSLATAIHLVAALAEGKQHSWRSKTKIEISPTYLVGLNNDCGGRIHRFSSCSSELGSRILMIRSHGP